MGRSGDLAGGGGLLGAGRKMRCYISQILKLPCGIAVISVALIALLLFKSPAMYGGYLSVR